MPSLSKRFSFGLGALALHQFSELPPPAWAGLGAPLLLLAWRYSIARLPAWAAAGFLSAWWTAALILAQGLPPELEGKDLVAEGVIVSLPDADADRTRFQFAIERLRAGDAVVAHPGRVQLSWYGH